MNSIKGLWSSIGAGTSNHSNDNDLQSIVRQDDAVIIDVRENFEFNSGHVDNARNMPLSQFGSFVNEIMKINAPIVLYCQSGNRSGQAVQMLKGKGKDNVYNGGSLGIMKSFMIR